jgi:nucleoid DNA-binding protein
MTLELWQWVLPLAQITVPQVTTPEAASVLFSGPRFFIALISGILLAFAIQLLLTNLSVAAGISYLGNFTSPRKTDDHSHSEHHHARHDDHHDDSDSGSTIGKITFLVGFGTLITVSIALFFACYLAVQLSLLTTPRLGIIISLVIWAAYFSLLVWVSSTTVGSLVGSVVQAATSGFQAVLGTATAAIGGQAAKRQVVSTAEAVAAAVRDELGAGIDPSSIRDSIEGYLGKLRLPSLDMNRIQSDLEGLLNDPELASLADSGQLKHIDRQTFLDLVSQRTDLSKQEVNRLADLLETLWKQTLGRRKPQDNTAELVEYLRSTQSGQLKIDELNAKIDRLLAERQSGSNQAGAAQSGGLQQTLQSGLNTAIGMLMGRTDLSDVNLDQIIQRIRSVSGEVSNQTQSLVAQTTGKQTYNPIEADVEDYLLNTYSWQMDRANVASQFRSILYDPAADPNAVIAALSRLNRARFVELLASRGVFTQSRIQEIADQLESIRQEVLQTAQMDREREIVQDLRQRIQIYLTLTPKDQLATTGDLPAFKAILEDSDADPEQLRQRFAEYNRGELARILQQRQDLSSLEQETILNALERTRDQVLVDSQSVYDQAKQRYSDFQQKLGSYLRDTGKSELNPEGIKRDLQLLVHDPATGVSALRHRASQFDRDTLVQLLSQRQDLSESEVNQILDQVESNWNSLVNAPSTAVQVVKDQYDQTLGTLSDYLRGTNLEELDPDGIQRDLRRLFENPKEGSIALRQRLSNVDRETLVRLLSQRQDITPEQANRIIDQVQGTIQEIIRSPRRLALRTQQKVLDFESSLEEYLRNTNKEELNPEGIKHDLGLMLSSPKLGLQNFGDRLSRIDRSTLVALLSQRQDISPEEADRIIGNIESVRDQAMAQVQQVQSKIQSVIDSIFARIRNYLNSLERPELNYDGIKQDVQTLFDDPQAGFEALRSRLSHFDRGTLVALLSSREDISEADANRIINQFESARTGVLQRAERIQTEAQRRVEAVKYQAQKQLDETRKAAATAAWWLFATALVSGAAAAVGGNLATYRHLI